MKSIPVQIILSLYANVTQLLCSFDIDSCCFAYQSGRVVCTARGLRALRHGVNVWDSQREGAAYSHRMEKWDKRGFTIALPGLVKERVSRHVRDGNYYELTCGMLLKADRPNVVAMQPAGPREEVRKKDTLVQRCAVLSGFERIWAKFV